MDVITAGINAMEGRTNTCMAVHPTEPLVVVGDDAGIVTLWDLSQAPPIKLAQLIGLPTAVKCLEFHKIFPLVAGACNDIVLMWKIDQINREQQDQQVQPSHIVSDDFRVRNEEEVQKELSETKLILEEAEKERRAIIHDQGTIKNNLRDIEKKIRAINEDNTFRRGALEELQAQKKTMTERFDELETRLKSITLDKEEKKARALQKELNLIRAGAREEVSCIAFYPRDYGNYSYIAFGVNNRNNIDDNRIIMYCFNIEPPSYLDAGYTISRNSLHRGPLDYVLLVSFSHDGKLFAFVTKSSDGRTVLKVDNFKGPGEARYHAEYESYRIDAEKKRSITSIRPYSSNIQVFSWGTESKHNFLIGCDDGYLTMIEAKTQTSNRYGAETSIQDLKSILEWNAGEEPIKCVAVHPSLPLFASGRRDVAKLWDIDQRKPLESLALQDVISVGFNQKFLAVCGSGSMHFYSCNSDDYGGLKEKYNKRKKLLGDLHDEIIQKTVTGQCAICFEPMIDSLTESAIRFGPKEEGYLPCTHKFHKNCIQPWLNQGKTSCPACRGLVPPSGLTLSTPPKVLADRSKNIKEKDEKWAKFDKETAKRALNFSTDAQGSPPPLAQGIRSDQQQPQPLQSSERPDSTPLTQEELRAARLEYFKPGSQGGRRNKNKYSKKKNSLKKSKFCHCYSKKNKK
jgi:WD40 repeat protein